MHQLVNSKYTAPFSRSCAHTLMTALVIPAAYYSTQSGDYGAFLLK